MRGRYSGVVRKRGKVPPPRKRRKTDELAESLKQPKPVVKKEWALDFGATELPTRGYKTYDVRSSLDWKTIYLETVKAQIRPAMADINVHYKRGKKEGVTNFGLSFREFPKEKETEVKLNPFMKMKKVGQIYYSKKNQKFIDSKKKATALDDVPKTDQSAYAKDMLRVMKGTAHSKGLESEHQEKAILGGSLIMTSERDRHWLNPHNAFIELYKVKHRELFKKDAPSFGKVFDKDVGTFVAGRLKGAELSKKLVDNAYLNVLSKDATMRTIFDEYVRKDPNKIEKHGKKSFEEWLTYKGQKIINWLKT